jgi:hypothetical protein
VRRTDPRRRAGGATTGSDGGGASGGFVSSRVTILIVSVRSVLHLFRSTQSAKTQVSQGDASRQRASTAMPPGKPVPCRIPEPSPLEHLILRFFLASARTLHMFAGHSRAHAEVERQGRRRRHPVLGCGNRCAVGRATRIGLRLLALGRRDARAAEPGPAPRALGRRTGCRRIHAGPCRRIGRRTDRRHTERTRRPGRAGQIREREGVA